MPSYDFPSNPSTNDTHTIGDKTWTFNGSAWEKTFSGDSIQIVGVSDFDGDGISGETFANTNELSFNSLTPGLTLSASQTGNRTLITWDALDIASRIGVSTTSWTYTSAADITIPGSGNIRHQTGTSRLLIHQVDSSGTNTRTTWATVRDDIENYGTSIIRLSFGDSERNYTVNAASYSSPVWTFTISEGNDQTSGTGKSVNAGGYVNAGQNTKISASEFYRLPGGETFDTVVTSFAGFTGAVAEGVTTNQILFHSGSSIAGSNDFTFDGTDIILGGDGHFDGGTDGPHQKKIKADEALAAGDPVYITGSVGASARVTVAKADASDPAKMPAAGIVKIPFSTNQEGYMTIGGSIDQFNTTGYTANDQLYVSPGGGLTSERPSSGSDLVQQVVRVGRVSATTGTIIVTGANRANDVPNLIHARAGISADAGITVDGNLNVKNDFEIRNEGGNAVFEVAGSGQNITIGDVDSAGNGNEIFIRDSHGIITITASSAITLNSDAVNLNDKLRHNSDINTHLAFPANDEIALTTGGVTLALLTDTFSLQRGLSLDTAGITFPDGTFQSTAAAGGGSSGVTQSIGFILDGNGSPIGTGDKLDALRQIPFDSYVLSTSAFVPNGVTGTTNEISFAIKKTSALSGSISGTNLVLGVTANTEQVGFTFAGAATSVVHFRELSGVTNTSGSTVDANEWIFPEVTGNTGDINKLQIFMTVVPTS